MIKEKFLKVLLWFRDHFRFLLEVVVRLSLGMREETNKPENNNHPIEEDDGKESKL